MLPSFFCVGAQKAGTTSIHEILIQHNDIFLPQIKETHFFYKDSEYQKGLDYYIKTYFKEWKGEKVVGEVEPDYMFFPFIPERIYNTLGADLKFIVLLRNPVDRAYSQYLMNVRRGFETESFENALKIEENRIHRNQLYFKRYSYVKRGLYSEQIKRMLEFYSIEHFMFILFESDFVANREKTIRKIFEFLGVSSDVYIDFEIKSNVASEPRYKFLNYLIFTQNPLKKIGRFFIPNRQVRRKIMRKLDWFNRKPIQVKPIDAVLKKTLLSKFFEKDIHELETIINRDLSCWLNVGEQNEKT